ncbi:MAG TPA: invasion associated locus B family protein [Thermohalobaculum sp.]|nr:invasion associated locus B family protein [Thermohalobaculum sp.]
MKQIVAACLLGALALPAISAAQNAQNQDPGETVKATHGAWEIVCATSQPDLCVMRQVGKMQDGAEVLEVRIRKLDGVTTQDGETVPAAIRILTPLGSVLQAGVTVQVDATEPRTGIYKVCVPQGCIVEDPMSAEFLGRLRAGAVANMKFGIIQQGEISVAVSLNGFTKAFNSL